MHGISSHEERSYLDASLLLLEKERSESGESSSRPAELAEASNVRRKRKDTSKTIVKRPRGYQRQCVSQDLTNQMPTSEDEEQSEPVEFSQETTTNTSDPS